MTSSIEAVRAALAAWSSMRDVEHFDALWNEMPESVQDLLVQYDAAIRERDELRGDAERLAWWFSWDAKPAGFMNTYLQGIRERWSLDQWRAAIDAARSTAQHPTKD